MATKKDSQGKIDASNRTSIIAFENIILPYLEIADEYFHGDWFSVEKMAKKKDKTRATMLCRVMDRTAGIDYIQNRGSFLRSWGIRCQRMETGVKPWNTFTSRFSKNTVGQNTEFRKRVTAIREQQMYPNWTMQAYYSDENKVLSVAAVETRQFYKLMVEQPDLIEEKNCYNCVFYSVKWSHLRDVGCKAYKIRF